MGRGGRGEEGEEREKSLDGERGRFRPLIKAFI